jgi:hypothetical protein
MIKHRTSISIPQDLIDKLQEIADEEYNVADLAILCLKRFIRRKKIFSVSNRPTCKYNDEPAPVIVNIWLTIGEHHNVKMYRILTGESVSFMTAQAIIMYIDAVESILKRLKQKPESLYAYEWTRMQNLALNCIERFIKFRSDGGKGMTGLSIVMPRPVLRWEKSFNRVPKYPPMPPELRERLGL